MVSHQPFHPISLHQQLPQIKILVDLTYAIRDSEVHIYHAANWGTSLGISASRLHSNKTYWYKRKYFTLCIGVFFELDDIFFPIFFCVYLHKWSDISSWKKKVSLLTRNLLRNTYTWLAIYFPWWECRTLSVLFGVNNLSCLISTHLISTHGPCPQLHPYHHNFPPTKL